MLIHNYGLFWRRAWIFWGRGGHNAGHLNGVPSTATTSDPVDFRYQQGVYVLYDENFEIVYIGQAGNGNHRLFDRLNDHTKDALAERWSRFSWFGIRQVNKDGSLRVEKNDAKAKVSDVLNHIEAILISAAEPPHNRQSGRFGKKVQQYIQDRDEINLGPEQEEMIREIWEKLQAGT